MFWMSSNSGQIGLPTMELAAIERLKKISYAYKGKNNVITFSPISFSYLQVRRTYIKLG